MKGTGAKRNVCPGSCVSTGAKFPVAPVESAPMLVGVVEGLERRRHGRNLLLRPTTTHLAQSLLGVVEGLVDAGAFLALQHALLGDGQRAL